MAHKKNRTNHHPIPPANQPKGPKSKSGAPERTPAPADAAGFHQHDAKRRLGDFEGTGEHSLVQPGGKNDAQRD